MARGATWDPDLEERIGDAIGLELRALGADLYGGVCVNLLRHPAWGRAQETYGEDPFHVGELGAALTRGVQRHVMATVKHFAANSMENARFKVDVTIDEDVLHEVYLPHFKRIVDEGVACVMSAYNSLNGDWCGQNRPLLTEILRDDWGFEGYVISDWIFGLRDAGPSITAGLDVEMPSPMIRHPQLDAALEAGEVTWADIDACVTRTLTALLRYRASHEDADPDAEVVACDAHRALAREAAAKGAVLLRNVPIDDDPLLPLDASSLRRVAVLGRLADVRNLGDGGSSDVRAPSAVTPLDGLVAALAGVDVVNVEDPDDAAGADAAVVVVGYTRADEGEYIGDDGTRHLRRLLPGPDDPADVAAFEARLAAEAPFQDPPGLTGSDSLGFAKGGDRRSLRLRTEDEELIQAVAAVNPRTVVVVISGSSVVMEGWRHAVPAIVQLWYAGMEGGHALADVLLGRVDATGRMPCTIPTDEDHLPPFDPDADAVTYDRWHGYWKLARDRHEPAYPFGFGLSYTAWALGPAAVEDTGDELVVTATLRNAGERRGADVVQVYAGRPADSSRPARRLVAFTRVELGAGESTVVELRVPWARLAVRDTTRRTWSIAPGTYVLTVARHSADLSAVDLVVDRA
jgi:beta-glucosidase